MGLLVCDAVAFRTAKFEPDLLEKQQQQRHTFRQTLADTPEPVHSLGTRADIVPLCACDPDESTIYPGGMLPFTDNSTGALFCGGGDTLNRYWIQFSFPAGEKVLSCLNAGLVKVGPGADRSTSPWSGTMIAYTGCTYNGAPTYLLTGCTELCTDIVSLGVGDVGVLRQFNLSCASDTFTDTDLWVMIVAPLEWELSHTFETPSVTTYIQCPASAGQALLPYTLLGLSPPFFAAFSLQYRLTSAAAAECPSESSTMTLSATQPPTPLPSGTDPPTTSPTPSSTQSPSQTPSETRTPTSSRSPSPPPPSSTPTTTADPSTSPSANPTPSGTSAPLQCITVVIMVQANLGTELPSTTIELLIDGAVVRAEVPPSALRPLRQEASTAIDQELRLDVCAATGSTANEWATALARELRSPTVSAAIRDACSPEPCSVRSVYVADSAAAALARPLLLSLLVAVLLCLC